MISQAVILAAGSGQRMFPLTNYTHKSLLPQNKSIIEHLVSLICKSGIKKITIIENKKKSQEKLAPQKCRTKLSRTEEEQNGAAQALVSREHTDIQLSVFRTYFRSKKSHEIMGRSNISNLRSGRWNNDCGNITGSS